ncbi:MAG: hypothetical protein ACYTG0_26160, partial [Planctomycetota bacterium]
MSDGPRRYQFGVRKLLLWTTAVALLLGTAAGSEAASGEQEGWLGFAICVVVVGAIRTAAGPIVAAALSAAAWTVLGAWGQTQAESSPGPPASARMMYGGVVGLA